MNNYFKGSSKLFVIAGLLLLISLSTIAADVKNVILMIGDGYGPAPVTLGRLALYGPSGKMAVDEMEIVGLMKTHCVDSVVTDSAAAGTALATGRRTLTKHLGMDQNKRPISTILEAAMGAGKGAGLVTTVRITHATPAAFASHVDHRDKELEIAAHMMEIRPHVLLGGGYTNFYPKEAGGRRTDRQDLLVKAQQRGYRVIDSRKELLEDKGGTGKLLGLFADSHLPLAIDRKNSAVIPTLQEMTEAALKRLSAHKEGFFLMIEGGQIDTTLHSHDTASTIKEIEEYDKSVAIVLDFARKNPGTLVISTADHDTGGMAISELVDIPSILMQKCSTYEIANLIRKDRERMLEIISENTGIEIKILKDWEKSFERSVAGRSGVELDMGYALAQINGIGYYHPAFQRKHSRTYGHTGVMVPIFAHGPGSINFTGIIDITEVAPKIAELMNIRFAPVLH